MRIIKEIPIDEFNTTLHIEFDDEQQLTDKIDRLEFGDYLIYLNIILVRHVDGLVYEYFSENWYNV